jgi:hypothetical protein
MSALDDDRPSRQGFRMNRRAIRAQQLTALVLHIVSPHICDHNKHRDRHNAVARALEEAFHRADIQILTEADRAELGLPRRGADGWTVEEILAYENRFLELLLRPPPAFVFPTKDKPK